MSTEKYRKIYNLFRTTQKRKKYYKLITYKLKFIDSYRFMATSQSSLTDNLSEIYKK